MKHRLFLYLLPAVFVICTSCISNEPLPSTHMVTTTTEPMKTITSTETVSPTIEEFTQIDKQCWPVKPLAEQNSINGSLVFAHYENNYRKNGDITSNEFLIWDISTSNLTHKKIISDTFYNDYYYVTPDGKYLARRIGKEFLLLGLDDNKSFELPMENMIIRSYLSENRVLLLSNSMFLEGNENKDTFTYYILDINSGNIADYEITLPNLSDPEKIQFHPDMRYVVYQSNSIDKTLTFTLFDISQNEIIWTNPNIPGNLKNNSYDMPTWIPNTNELVDTYFDMFNENFYIISTNGNVSPLTFYKDTSVHNIPSKIWWGSRFSYPNWSSNGDYMLFRKNQSGSLSKSYMIWDNQNKIAYEPCIPYEDENVTTTYHAFQWSYDGLYLLASFMVPNKEEIVINNNIIKTHPVEYILDLKNKVIYVPPDGKNEFIESRTDDLDLNVFLSWVDWELP